MGKRRMAMRKDLMEKAREATTEEALAKERELSEQLFRLKFQFANGQNDALRKIRELRRDIARIKTIRREREAEVESEVRA